MSEREEYYARIRAVVGNTLADRRISVSGAGFLAKAVELLSCCGVVKFNFRSGPGPSFLFKLWGPLEWGVFEEGLAAILRGHNHFETGWQFSAGVDNSPTDLVIGGGDFLNALLSYQLAQRKNAPAVIGIILKCGSGLISVVYPGEKFPWHGILEQKDCDPDPTYLNWVDLNNQVANLAKGVLLQKTKWARADLDELFSRKQTTLLTGHPTWSWVSRYLNLNNKEEVIWLKEIISQRQEAPKEETMYGQRVMVVGLGSLGSLMADHFRVLGASLIGIDGKKVSLYNPVRQLYSTRQIGVSKPMALVSSLAISEGRYDELYPDQSEYTLIVQNGKINRFFAGIEAEMKDSAEGQEKFEDLVERFRPHLVVLATAHPAEYRMAYALRLRGIPHLAVCCYRRARWFEIISVDGANGPCLGCLKGHLYTGIPPSLTEEELARYEPNAPVIQALDAEPATRVDSARCADAAVRLGVQLMLPEDGRAEWFRRMTREERNFLIGGNTAEFREDKREWSHGVETPGSAVLYGVINLVGSTTQPTKKCIYCGREYEVLIHRQPAEV